MRERAPKALSLTEGLSENQRSVFAMPTYAIILSSVASILLIVGGVLLLIRTFEFDADS